MKILKLRGYILFLSLGMVIFFIGAFSVILVRTKDPYLTTMPNLIGKNYVSVHNELIRLRLKVSLENTRIPEKNDGEIVAQSISPGKQVDAGSHVYLTVVQGFDRVEMPNIIGQNLSTAKGSLDKVLSGETYVSMPIGGITFVPAKETEQADTVIDQIPEPGKITNSGEKVYLLVTEPSNPKNKNDQSFNSIPLPIAGKALNAIKFPWKITSWEPTQIREQIGLIKSSTQNNGMYEFVVFKKELENRIEEGYEFVDWKIPRDGVYQVSVDRISNSDQREIIYLPQSFRKDEILSIVLYRKGDIVAKLLTIDDKEIDKEKFKSEI
ncbi:PASTA domain-containing protein [Leptospira sp. GIMC2001]|uniref:PASTA domain-containing protein n=1 Tax=Leptospira sp. GIMC2001 TaxID=1513297 RepID=UPI00234B0114|nr:PASTA domain-containing protein [Leptospira sp. GIMC2001]WCL47918.1 PASTA domain-containing protein [Leptospira sp. GIMC2001]